MLVSYESENTKFEGSFEEFREILSFNRIYHLFFLCSISSPTSRESKKANRGQCADERSTFSPFGILIRRSRGIARAKRSAISINASM